DRRYRGSRTRRQRLPHAAFEDPGADGAGAALGPEGHVRAIGEDRRRLDLRAEPLQIERFGVVDADRALGVADRDVLELPRAPAGGQLAAAVRRAAGEVGAPEARAAHVDAARGRTGDRRPDLAGRRLDAE